MTKEQDIKSLQTVEEKKMEQVDSKNHPSKHENDKDLMTAEEIQNWAELDGKVDTTNLGS